MGRDCTAARSPGPLSPRRCEAERRMGARMIAMGLAMRMKMENADSALLGQAVIATQEALGPGDGLARRVAMIAHRWRELRADAAALSDAGETLMREVMASCRPPLPFRADIDG